MQAFRVREGVREGEAPEHTASPPCPACEPGYPQPCPRITGQAFLPPGFDDAGVALGEPVWTVTRCPGWQHAEIGTVLELRCAACGVPA